MLVGRGTERGRITLECLETELPKRFRILWRQETKLDLSRHCCEGDGDSICHGVKSRGIQSRTCSSYCSAAGRAIGNGIIPHSRITSAPGSVESNCAEKFGHPAL